jgi:hypothetical protein
MNMKMTTTRPGHTLAGQTQSGRRLVSIPGGGIDQPAPAPAAANTAPGGATGFLSIAAAAAELVTTELAVRRIIARCRLGAVRLGLDGPWRISCLELGRYIGAGCPDLKPPAFTADWIDHRGTATAKAQFADAMDKALLAALPEKAPVDDRETWQQADAMQIEVPASAEMLALAKKPIDFTFTPSSAQFDCPDVATAFFVDVLRDLVGAMLPSSKPRLASLYAGPEAYGKLASDGTDKMRAIAFSRRADLPAADGSGNKAVVFNVRYRDFLDSSRLVSVWQLAF